MAALLAREARSAASASTRRSCGSRRSCGGVLGRGDGRTAPPRLPRPARGPPAADRPAAQRRVGRRLRVVGAGHRRCGDRARRRTRRGRHHRRRTACTAGGSPSPPRSSACSSGSTSPVPTTGRTVAACSAPVGDGPPVLAREAPADADIVIPVPEAGRDAAAGFAAEAGLPFADGLVKNRYVGRTFIQPTQTLRQLGIKAQALAGARDRRGPPAGRRRRLDRAWQHLPPARGDAAGGRGRGGPPAHHLTAHHRPVLLRHRHGHPRRAHRRGPRERRGDPEPSSAATRCTTSPSTGSSRRPRRRANGCAPPASPATTRSRSRASTSSWRRSSSTSTTRRSRRRPPAEPGRAAPVHHPFPAHRRGGTRVPLAPRSAGRLRQPRVGWATNDATTSSTRRSSTGRWASMRR
jgi:hypothetical protein